MTDATGTATTHAARDHARAQEAAAAEDFYRPVPPTSALFDEAAAALPDGVPDTDVLWNETVDGGNYAVRVLPRGARLRLCDIAGDTAVQMLIFNHHQRAERLNVADTVKVQWQAYLGEGSLLLSDMGRTLMSILSDTTAGHDMFNTMSNRKWNDDRYGDGAAHGETPCARDLHAVALAKAGLERRDIGPPVNFFKKVRVAPDGSFTWFGDESPAGGELLLRADMDVLVCLTVTPHVLDPRPDYTATPLQITAWKGDPAGVEDPVRLATPEGRRAFENVDDWFLTRELKGALA